MSKQGIWRSMWCVALGLVALSFCDMRLLHAADDLEQGIIAAQEGLYNEAVQRLSNVIGEMERVPHADARRLARAYLYLAVARFGLEQPEAAKTAFGRALERDPTIEVTAKEFPPKFLRFLTEARFELETQRASIPITPPAVKKDGGSKKTLVIVGSAAAAGAIGGGYALVRSKEPACDPGGSVTATATSSASGRTLNCTDTEQLTVQLVNDTCDTVAVQRVTRTGRGTLGNCGATLDMYTPSVPSLASRRSATLLDNRPASSLPGGVSGCCRGLCPAPPPQCELTYEVVVETSAEPIAAGTYQTITTFTACPICQGPAALLCAP